MSKYNHGNNIHEHRKHNEPHIFALNLPQRLDLRSSNKHVALQNLCIYYTSQNIRKQYKNNNECESPDGSYSVSDIQDYIEYIKKSIKH